ncbi:MAG: serine/threonine protein kinase, partial [Deltaproteobacteria bacterium]
MVQTRHHRLDYEVLWGVITHRLGYASAREIEAAFRRCTADRCQSLGEILVEEGVITPETRERIEELAFTALRNHQGNTVEILRSLGGRATLEHCFGGSVCFRGKHELALIFATEGGDGTTVAERPTEEGSITTVVERPAEEGSITTVVERPTEGGNRTTAVERPTEGGKSLAATQEPPLADPRLEETASIHIEGSSAQEGRKHPSSRPNTSPSSGVPLRTPSPSPGSWRHRFGETQPLALDASSGASSAPNDTRVSDFDERYVITDPIGKGGMGLVYEGKDLELNRKLAIKVMRQEYRTSPKLVAKFIKEAQIQGQLEHPNICPVHELGVNAQGHLYFTMKRVKGQSLQQMLDDLRRKGDRGESLFSLLEIFKKICDGVAFAHARGVIHRDLKPNNIMIGEFGE